MRKTIGAILWGVFTLLFGLQGFAWSQGDDGKIREALELFNRANHLHQEVQLDEAIELYRQAAKLDDQNPWIFNALGLAYAGVGDFSAALKSFREALKINPDITDVHNNMGVVYAEMGNRDKAFQEFGLVTRDPSYPTPEKALFNLGNLYLAEKNLELALIHYQRAVEKNPKFALGYRGLGKVSLALGERPQAMKQFGLALESFPDDKESLYELARLYEQDGDLVEARQYYRRVVEVDRFSTLGQLSLQRLDALKPGT